MERFAVLLVTAMLCSNPNAIGQTFSTDVEYTSFYKARFNPNFDGTSEPTIAIWWIIEQFGVASVPLEKLHEHLLRYQKLYPDSKHAERVADHLKVVQRMLGETRPPDEQRIQQLIFDLRYLNHQPFGQPNSGVIVVGPQPTYQYKDGTPLPDNVIRRMRTQDDAADHLRDIGYDCVPTLIDHIDDSTLTRSVSYWRDFTFSHRVLTVGECCLQILNVIAPSGRQFEIGETPDETKQAMKNHYMSIISQKRKQQQQEEQCEQ
jgi:hypothetical protein